MKIVVIGASRGTGALSVASALAKGHEVTACARTPSKLTLEHPKLTKKAGDFHDAASMHAAIAGQDAVILTASASKLSDFQTTPDYFSRGTKFCIDAMKAHGVKRLVVLSAAGSGESRATSGWLVRTFLVDGLLKRAFVDHDIQERMALSSGLEVVIARPTRLTDGPAKGRYTKTAELVRVPSSISRADVADFMVEACSDGTFVGKAVLLGG